MGSLAAASPFLALLVLSACGVHRDASPPPAPYATAASSGGEQMSSPMAVMQDVSSDEAEEEGLVQGDQMPREANSVIPTVHVSGGAGQPPPRAPLLASAEPSQPNTAPKPGQPHETARADALHTGPLLIYSAAFQLHVYEVEKAQAELKAAAKQLGGFVSEQTDAALTMRVPSARFEEALVAIEGTGKVRARHVQALDVGEQYRDLSLRLRTAEALRDRLEAMLARAAKVDEALQVERELERIVREIEQIKGQLRAMGDRIAFSTITVDFRPEARPDLDDSDAFRLPYAWLEELGLHHLLELTQ